MGLVKLLLDENFPLPLYHELRAAGYDVEHIIVLGQRGLPDAVIRQRLALEEIVFLTQDTEFEDLPADYRAIVIISRVRQNLPIQQRVDIWFKAIQDFMTRKPTGKLFDLLETGEVMPWEIHKFQ
jgi:predicted nuclease of predicted toxin-antitoxin system